MNFELWEQCGFMPHSDLGFALSESCSAASGPVLANEAAQLDFVLVGISKSLFRL